MHRRWTPGAVITSAVVGLLGGLLAALSVVAGMFAQWTGLVAGVALVAALTGPPAYALGWLRLRGAALLTSIVTAVLVGALWPVLWVGFVGTVAVGVLVETPYLLGSWRNWSAAPAGISGGLGGLGSGVLTLAPWTAGPHPATIALSTGTGVVIGVLTHAVNARRARRNEPVTPART